MKFMRNFKSILDLQKARLTGPCIGIVSGLTQGETVSKLMLVHTGVHDEDFTVEIDHPEQIDIRTFDVHDYIKIERAITNNAKLDNMTLG